MGPSSPNVCSWPDSPVTRSRGGRRGERFSHRPVADIPSVILNVRFEDCRSNSAGLCTTFTQSLKLDHPAQNPKPDRACAPGKRALKHGIVYAHRHAAQIAQEECTAGWRSGMRTRKVRIAALDSHGQPFVQQELKRAVDRRRRDLPSGYGFEPSHQRVSTLGTVRLFPKDLQQRFPSGCELDVPLLAQFAGIRQRRDAREPIGRISGFR